ncbi:hypothetical protein MASR1M6_20440 [Rubrivivax sp.]|jgi:hypothetical protein
MTPRRPASLADAIARQPSPPCDAPSCPVRSRCAQEKLACEAFAVYVKTGLRFRPCSKFDARPGRPQVVVLWEQPQPSADLCLRVFGRGAG